MRQGRATTSDRSSGPCGIAWSCPLSLLLARRDDSLLILSISSRVWSWTEMDRGFFSRSYPSPSRGVSARSLDAVGECFACCVLFMRRCDVHCQW
jgi:hypothetical protein